MSKDNSDFDKTVVLGVGNLILKDEGIGIHVIQELERLELPENVELIDGGTCGLDLVNLIGDAKRLIIIDTVEAGAEPGTIFRFVPEDAGKPEGVPRYSLHDIGLLEALELARQLGKKPETIIYGIQPKEIGWGLEPTEELARKIPKLVELVIREIEGNPEIPGPS